MNRLAITEVQIDGKQLISYIILDENRKFVDFQLYDTRELQPGDIYIARVEKIVPSIQAAFLVIADQVKCYLPLENFQDAIFVKKQSPSKLLSQGDYLLVQVEKAALKTKDPVVTEKLSIHGKLCVLTSHKKVWSVSNKIEKQRREQLLQELDLVKQSMVESPDFGVVLRTDAKNASPEEWKQDLLDTIQFYKDVIHQNLHNVGSTCIHKEPSGYISRIKSSDLSGIDKIVTDQKFIYEMLMKQLPEFYHSKLEFYEDKLSLKTLYHIEGKIQELLSQKVWLKSGANIIIEQLETITFIDVNSAKNASHKEDVLLDINLEAAEEIALQLRLRNISGMIIVDFINMKSPDANQTLINHIKHILEQDTVSCQFVDMTRLGLVEITRKKVYKSIRELL